jgi:large subunit ribosomal protein L3
MFGRKIGMTQIFGPDQDLMPVTVLEVGPSFVSQVKTSATDGYAAVQVASEPKKKFSRPSEGHLKKAGLAPGFSRFLEFRTTDPSAFSPGAPVELSLFKEGSGWM